MKSTTRLDSTVFQLTPTRTRFDLYIVANGKKEKLASGLLKPFLPHLKTAEEQIAKGGYSILLEPPAADNATWFTKGTLERFVRFVSTPEILERVYTIESEIVQIEKAISAQGNNDIGTKTIEDHHVKPVLAIEGNSSKPDANEEKAIVLYTPGTQSTEANGSIIQEENSKVELLKVLDTRKTVLQKEQGMAFARATAAGFDMDHMTPLVSFAKCFGASRLLDACLRFMDLWKGKHESGQWLEIEAAETVSSKSEFLTMHASGIMLSSIANKHEMQQEFVPEIDDKAGPDKSAGLRPPVSYQVQLGQQEYFPGQFPHPMFPPWPMQSPSSGMPFYPGYPMQGTPYYQNYVGSGPYQQPFHQVAEDSQVSINQRERPRRQSLDSSDGSTESDTSEIDASGIKMQNDLHKKITDSEPRKKAGRSGKKKRDMVVIRNINYVTSKQKKSSGSESNSDSGSETDGDGRDLLSEFNKSYDKEESAIADGGHWQAFQSCLLRDTNEDSLAVSDAMFASEKDVKIRRKQNTVIDDPLAFTERNPVESQGRWSTKFDKASGNVSRLNKASNDELSTARVEGHYRNGRLGTDDMQFPDINGSNILLTTGNDEFMVAGRENKSEFRSASDLAINKYEVSTDNMAYMADESFIVPFRSMSLDQVGSDDRANYGMDPEISSKHESSENIVNMDRNQLNDESAEVSLLPERGSEKRSLGYDPALDYETHFGHAASVATKHKEAVTDAKQVSKNTHKDKKSKVVSETLDKKKFGGPVRRGKQSKLSPVDEARLRAEKLRTYKADLQKLKKEKEEAEHKRIEALKMERQKRITARGSSTSAQSSLPSLSARKSLPTKTSPISHRGSKFSDSEPGSSSPLQRSKIRTASLGSADSKLASKISKSIDFNHLPGNRLTRSVSSLTDAKNEPSSVTPDSKASMARIRKLSEPKTISGHPALSLKSGAAESLPKLKVSNGSEGKKKNAIVNLDRTKGATLPEVKTKTSKGTLNVKQKKLVEKDTTLKVNEGKSSVPSGRIHENLDDNLVVEKTVVMLECQKSSVLDVGTSVGVAGKHNDINDSQIDNLVVSEYAPIRATPSPFFHPPRISKAPMITVDQEPSLIQSQEKTSSSKVMTNTVSRGSTTFSSIGISEEPYQAPFARVSSIEDPCTRNSEYGKVPTSSLLSVTTKTTENHTSHSENMKFEKPLTKESSKGFRRFLKMGRKNHSSTATEQNAEVDNTSINEVEQDKDGKIDATSTEGLTLKNLISQDETPTAASTSQKSSRHFSLLSHFRSKTSEKKLIS
ncbi:COP1-interacting protein-related [Heracleum sosnowskyi]|uniref:COP1-interacting protein-related n=1 Tax=Heracleum sosnowskyi TaxID=360622 RepID=A0AAD8J2X2_9APIA|nr:COP1-interacting protein-related [Heracleum sosnowskyi]